MNKKQITIFGVYVVLALILNTSGYVRLIFSQGYDLPVGNEAVSVFEENKELSSGRAVFVEKWDEKCSNAEKTNKGICLAQKQIHN
jgi:hypothetical protein